MSETSVEERAGIPAAAILELDRDRGVFPGYYAAVVIRPTAAEVFSVQEVRGALSQILKSDYHAKNDGPHSVYVRSDGTTQQGTVFTLTRL